MESMYGVSSAIQDSGESTVNAIESLDIHVSNEDVIAMLTTVNTSLTTVKASVDAMNTNLSTVNSNLASKIQSSGVLKASTARMAEILSADIPANTPKKLFSSNSNRLGFFIYNNSTNSLYFGPANSPAGAKVFGQLASNAGPTALQAFLGPVVWTGEIWVIRNAGTGGIVGYELEA